MNSYNPWLKQEGALLGQNLRQMGEKNGTETNVDFISIWTSQVIPD